MKKSGAILALHKGIHNKASRNHDWHFVHFVLQPSDITILANGDSIFSVFKMGSDQFICGTCQTPFKDLEMFMEHKRLCDEQETAESVQMSPDDRPNPSKIS